MCAAELQFAFICFLIGNVYDAFEHWKRLLNILCRSEDAIGKYQDVYINLISVLYHQLSEIPADFFVDIVSQDNFLTSTLQVHLWLSLEKWGREEGACRTSEQTRGEAAQGMKPLLGCMGDSEPIHTHVCSLTFSPVLVTKNGHLLLISESELLKLCLEGSHAVIVHVQGDQQRGSERKG